MLRLTSSRLIRLSAIGVRWVQTANTTSSRTRRIIPSQNSHRGNWPSCSGPGGAASSCISIVTPVTAFHCGSTHAYAAPHSHGLNNVSLPAILTDPNRHRAAACRHPHHVSIINYLTLRTYPVLKRPENSKTTEENTTADRII